MVEEDKGGKETEGKETSIEKIKFAVLLHGVKV